MFRNKKRSNYSNDEVDVLINIWADENIQKKFHESGRHNLIWKSISEALEKYDYVRTADEIKNKLRNLKCEYYKINRSSGSATPTWRWFGAMSSVLGQRDLANETLAHDSLPETDPELGSISTLVNGDSMEGESQPQQTCSQMQDIVSESEGNALQTPNEIPSNNSQLRTPVFSKIKRSRRKHNTDENSFLQTLISLEKQSQTKINEMLARDELNKKRDDELAAHMTDFLQTYTALGKRALNSPVSNATPIRKIPEASVNTAVCQQTYTALGKRALDSQVSNATPIKKVPEVSVNTAGPNSVIKLSSGKIYRLLKK